MKEIQLTKGKVALVDDWNYEWLNQWRWCYKLGRNGNGYAARKVKGRTIRMHRLIMSTPKGMETDHGDSNGLNNQEYNLRIATNSQNQMNMKSNKNTTSKYKGVSWRKKSKSWITQIQFNGKKTHIGYFNSETKAAHAYDKQAKELFGKFAKLNFKED